MNTNYHVKQLQIIGESNHSIIYRLPVHPLIPSELALKVILHSKSKQNQCPIQCEQLHKEFLTSQELNHSCVAKQLAFFKNSVQQKIKIQSQNEKGECETALQIYGVAGCSILMEYASDGDLIDLINKNMKGSYDLTYIKKLFRPVVSGLTYMHEQGYAHNDVKLENIFLYKQFSSDDDKKYFVQPRIADFGFSNKSAKTQQQQYEDFKYRNPELLSPELINLMMEFKLKAKKDQQKSQSKTNSVENSPSHSSSASTCGGDSSFESQRESFEQEYIMIDEQKADIYALGMSIFQAFAKIVPVSNIKLADRLQDPAYVNFCQGNFQGFWENFPDQYQNFHKFGMTKYNNNQILCQFFNLIQGMIDPNPQTRLSSKQVLEHQFFNQE